MILLRHATSWLQLPYHSDSFIILYKVHRFVIANGTRYVLDTMLAIGILGQFVGSPAKIGFKIYQQPFHLKISLSYTQLSLYQSISFPHELFCFT